MAPLQQADPTPPEVTQPVLRLEFGEWASKKIIGSECTVETKPLLPLDAAKLPAYGHGPLASHNLEINTSYYQQLNHYLAWSTVLKPIGFAITNMSTITILDVRMRLVVPPSNGMVILSDTEYPEKPRKVNRLYHSIGFPYAHSNLPHSPSAVLVEKVAEGDVIEIEFRKVQPKATVWANGVVYLGSLYSGTFEYLATVYADNLPSPLNCPLTIVVNAKPPIEISKDMLLKYRHD